MNKKKCGLLPPLYLLVFALWLVGLNYSHSDANLIYTWIGKVVLASENSDIWQGCKSSPVYLFIFFFLITLHGIRACTTSPGVKSLCTFPINLHQQASTLPANSWNIFNNRHSSHMMRRSVLALLHSDLTYIPFRHVPCYDQSCIKGPFRHIQLRNHSSVLNLQTYE